MLDASSELWKNQPLLADPCDVDLTFILHALSTILSYLLFQKTTTI